MCDDHKVIPAPEQSPLEGNVIGLLALGYFGLSKILDQSVIKEKIFSLTQFTKVIYMELNSLVSKITPIEFVFNLLQVPWSSFKFKTPTDLQDWVQ